jgi:hypothetical protein
MPVEPNQLEGSTSAVPELVAPEDTRLALTSLVISVKAFLLNNLLSFPSESSAGKDDFPGQVRSRALHGLK